MEGRRAVERAEKRRYFEAHLKSWKASGLTQAQYCRQNELGVHQFLYWKKKILPEKASLVELPRALFAQSSPGILLVVGGTLRIELQEGFDPAMLEQVLRVMARL